MSATIKITRDRLAEDETWTLPSYKGKTWTFDGGVVVTEHRRRWSLVDDDGITYYEGYVKGDTSDAVEEALDWLFDWGSFDSGTTLLRVDGKDYIG